MEPSNRRPLFIGLVIVGLITVVCCCCALFAAIYFLPRSASSWEFGIGPRRTVTETTGPDRFAIESGSSLVVENSVGDIEIRAGERDEITLEVSKTARASDDATAQRLLRASEVAIEQGQGEFRITVHTPKNQGSNTVSVDLVIHAPPRTGLTVLNGVGDVTARDIDGEMAITTDVGDIEVNDASLMAGSTLKSGVGGVRFTGALPREGLIEMATGVGDISLRLPADSAFYLDAAADVGRIDVDLPMPNPDVDAAGVGDKRQGQIGAGGDAQLKMQVGTGNISIEVK